MADAAIRAELANVVVAKAGSSTLHPDGIFLQTPVLILKEFEITITSEHRLIDSSTGELSTGDGPDVIRQHRYTIATEWKDVS